MKAVQHAIKRVNTTGRRSVFVAPLSGGRSTTLNKAFETAVSENIVVVTSAGKSILILQV